MSAAVGKIMTASIARVGALDGMLATVLLLACALAAPLYWWLFITPLIRAAKSIGQWLKNKVS